MKPQKQTVFLPVKVDDEFWKKWDSGQKPDYDLADIDTGENVESWVNEKQGYFFTPEQLNEYTANVIKRALETAAETRCIKIFDKNWFAYSIEEGTKFFDRVNVTIDKQSITNTFEETFKLFEV